jgi:hypothetical protein
MIQTLTSTLWLMSSLTLEMAVVIVKFSEKALSHRGLLAGQGLSRSEHTRAYACLGRTLPMPQQNALRAD